MEERLARIDALAESNDREGALEEATRLTSEYPADGRAFRARAYVLKLLRRWEEAILDLDKAISLQGNEPTLWFERAWAHLSIQRYEAAVRDWTEVLRLEESLGSEWYRDSARFLRAWAELYLGRYEDVLADVAGLAPDFRWYVLGRVRTAAELESRARQNLGR